KKGSLVHVQGPQTHHQHFNTGDKPTAQLRLAPGLRFNFFQQIARERFPYLVWAGRGEMVERDRARAASKPADEHSHGDGSDIHGSERLRDGPKILGHENVGIITKIGRQASEKWKVVEGDRVALEEYVPCGACKWCRSEDFRFCEATDIAGPGPRLWYGST